MPSSSNSRFRLSIQIAWPSASTARSLFMYLRLPRPTACRFGAVEFVFHVPLASVGFESDTHVVEQVFREELARVLAALVRSRRDFELAEDALQEAFAMALERWPSSGAPDSPAAWLLTVARSRAIDRVRRHRTRPQKLWE